MNSMSTQSWVLLAGALAVALIGLAAWLIYRRRQSSGLQRRFGPEYARTVEGLGSQAKAEAELRARETRVGRLNIVALSAPEVARFSQTWNALQSSFVDNPKGVLGEADQLVRELMSKRGYPMAEFEHRAADISVDHPSVVDHYRAAQAIAVRDQRGEADTEQLRKGVVHYRALFQELLEIAPPEQILDKPVGVAS